MSDELKNKIIGGIITAISSTIIIYFIISKLTYDFIGEYYNLTTIDSYKEFQNNRYINNSSSFTNIPEYYDNCSRVEFNIISKTKYNDNYIKVDYTVKTDMNEYFTCSDLWQIKGKKVLRKNNLYTISGM